MSCWGLVGNRIVSHIIATTVSINYTRDVNFQLHIYCVPSRFWWTSKPQIFFFVVLSNLWLLKIKLCSHTGIHSENSPFISFVCLQYIMRVLTSMSRIYSLCVTSNLSNIFLVLNITSIFLFSFKLSLCFHFLFMIFSTFFDNITYFESLRFLCKNYSIISYI